MIPFMKKGDFEYNALVEEMNQYENNKGIWYSSDGPDVVLCIVKPQLIQEIYNNKYQYFRRTIFLGHEHQSHIFGKSVYTAIGNKYDKLNNFLSPQLQSLIVEDNLLQYKNAIKNSILPFKGKMMQSKDFVVKLRDLGVDCMAIAFKYPEFRTDFQKQYNYDLHAVFDDFNRERMKLDMQVCPHLFEQFYRDLPMETNRVMNERVRLAKEAALMIIASSKYSDDFQNLQKLDILGILLSHVNKVSSGPDQQINSKKSLKLGEVEDLVILFMHNVSVLLGSFLQSVIICLAQYPEIQEQARQEIYENIKKHPKLNLVDLINYLDLNIGFLKEVLRLFPPMPDMFKRIAIKDVELSDGINNYYIPQGTNVRIPVYNVHTYSGHWEDPFEFNPSRFVKGVIHPYQFIPFGKGLRGCMGESFCMFIAKVFLIQLISMFRVSFKENIKIHWRRQYSLSTETNYEVYFEELDVPLEISNFFVD